VASAARAVDAAGRQTPRPELRAAVADGSRRWPIRPSSAARPYR